MAQPRRICSVTVAFDPDPGRLAMQMDALQGQVHTAFVVDNGSAPEAARAIAQLERPGVRMVRAECNEGIGAGLNRGIAAAEAHGCTHVLLLDHDSVPAPGMVAALDAAMREAEANGRVAAVGPRVRDSRDGHEFPFIRLGWLHNPRIRCADNAGLIGCDFLITSGSLVAMRAFRDIGAFDASLFVEYVDLDWCCRARARGYSLHGVCGARLDHELGEEPRTVFGGLRLLVHPPERLYYALRNRVLMYRRAHVPLRWKVKDIPRAALKLLTTLLFVAPRAQYARMALLAVRDGVRGRGGPRDRLGRSALG